jgi:inhibitor of the pro-sigma K processing machinery
MGTEWIVAIVIIALLIVAAASSSITKPLRWIGMLGLHVIIGAVLLLITNVVGDMAGFHIPLNPVTALLVGFLRIPGLLALISIKLFIM